MAIETAFGRWITERIHIWGFLWNGEEFNCFNWVQAITASLDFPVSYATGLGDIFIRCLVRFRVRT